MVVMALAATILISVHGAARVAYGRPAGLLVAITPQEILQAGREGFPSVMRVVDRPVVLFRDDNVVFSGQVHLGRRTVAVWGMAEPRVQGTWLVWRIDRLVAGGVPVSPFWLLSAARLAGVSGAGLVIDPWRAEIRINTSAISGPLHNTVLDGAWVENGYLFVTTVGR